MARTKTTIAKKSPTQQEVRVKLIVSITTMEMKIQKFKEKLVRDKKKLAQHKDRLNVLTEIAIGVLTLHNNV